MDMRACVELGKFLKKWWVMERWGGSSSSGVGYIGTGVGGLCRGGEGLAFFFPIYIQPFMNDSNLRNNKL